MRGKRSRQASLRVGIVVVVVVGTLLAPCVAGAGPTVRALQPFGCEALDAAERLAWCVPEDDDAPLRPPTGQSPRGFTDLANPAVGRTLQGTESDPLAAFSQRPFVPFIIPEGGLFLDPLHGSPHYGIDYANPGDYLNGDITYFRPIGPGYVTARSTCVPCYVDGDSAGRVLVTWPRYNFGWGNLVLVETPFTSDVSIYVLYAHLARDFVSLGDYVTPDDVIGVVGTTGYSQTFHLHVEIRFGPPGRFWNADFSQWATLDRWMATMFINPAYLILPESHPAFLTALNEWLALQPPSSAIP